MSPVQAKAKLSATMTPDAGTSQSQMKSPILSLPPEMRNRIYRECVVEGVITLHSDDMFDSLPVEPALLLTCRQIRKEALSIYYHENKFEFCISHHDAGNYIKWYKSAKRRLHSNIFLKLN